MTVPTGPGLPKLSKIHGIRCAGKWRSICLGGPDWSPPENRWGGEVCPECEKGHAEALRGPNVGGKSYADSKSGDKSGLGPGPER